MRLGEGWRTRRGSGTAALPFVGFFMEWVRLWWDLGLGCEVICAGQLEGPALWQSGPDMPVVAPW